MVLKNVARLVCDNLLEKKNIKRARDREEAKRGEKGRGKKVKKVKKVKKKKEEKGGDEREE